jgi:hypothetical protein
MRHLLTLALVLTLGVGHAQDYKYLDEVEIDTKVIGNTVILDFKKIFIANIVLSDSNGGILEKRTNYKTTEDLKLTPSKYGSGTYYVYIQLNDMIAIKRVTVREEKKDDEPYTDMYKIVIK